MYIPVVKIHLNHIKCIDLSCIFVLLDKQIQVHVADFNFNLFYLFIILFSYWIFHCCGFFFKFCFFHFFWSGLIAVIFLGPDELFIRLIESCILVQIPGLSDIQSLTLLCSVYFAIELSDLSKPFKFARLKGFERLENCLTKGTYERF